jgi:aryl-alcohol dehydrogenase-like predicted oxidoreductase
MSGETGEEEPVKTIHVAAVERGINLIDTTPAQLGRSEEIVGRAIADRSLRSPRL